VVTDSAFRNTTATEMTMSVICKIAAVAMIAGFCAPAVAADETWSKVGEALGKTGTEMPGGVYRSACRAPISRSLSTGSS